MPLLFSLGLLFLLALGAGRLCARFHVPRVTGYLLVGVLGGPSLVGLLGFTPLIDRHDLGQLEMISEVALGLIILYIGGSFQIRTIRRIGSGLLVLSFTEILVTGLIVAGAALLAGASTLTAGFLAVLAATTAPAATQMVVREYEAEGSLTDLVMTLIGMNNLVAITLFVILIHGFVAADSSPVAPLYHLGLPLALGIGVGSFLAVMDQRLVEQVERQIVGLALVAALIGGSHFLGISPMLAALVAGAVLVNTSPFEQRLLRDLGRIDYPLYVLFFLVAGAELQLELLPQMGVLGLAYTAARAVGKLGGCAVGSHLARFDSQVRKWLGPAMLAQAGLAIGLSSALAREWGDEGVQVQTAVLAAVVVFEGIGPLLTRLSLVKVGEVTALGLLAPRAPVGYFEGLHEVVNHFREALGIPHFRSFRDPSEILIAHVMRRNVEVVGHDTPFDRILHNLGHSRYDRLPVVDDDGELVGVIQYSDVAHVLLDPALRSLIVARDIATQEHFFLKPSDTLQKALNELKTHPNHTYLLVVEEENPSKLAGVVRHNDVLSAQRRLRRR